MEGLPTSSSEVSRNVIGRWIVGAHAQQLPYRFERDVVAPLHVEYAGAVAFVALAPPRQFCERADRMHGVEMAHDQDAGF